MMRTGVVALVSLSLLVAACGAEDSAGPGASSTSSSTTTTTAAAPVGDVVGSHTAFTVDLFKAVAADERGNVVLSPHGVDMVLSMILAGARGQTAAEIERALHVSTLDVAGLAGLAGLERTLRSRSHDGMLVELAASEWVHTGYPLLAEYRSAIEHGFGAKPHQADFAKARAKAVDAINRDIAEATHDKIPKLLDDLDPLTRLVLVSTAYLEARWSAEFAPERTKPDAFTLANGSVAQRPMMRQTDHFATAKGQGWRAVTLPYAGGELSMVVIVPDDLSRFTASLTPEVLAAAASPAGKDHEVDLSMPKFEFRLHTNLVPALTGLGVKAAFDASAADLSGMTSAEALSVSTVVQEAWVQVDEHGTKAAAATEGSASATALRERAEPERFAVDRPFLFAIRDNPTGAVLFIGRVLDPQP
jgi:serpin B